jgi:flagellar protein FliO/FliZ
VQFITSLFGGVGGNTYLTALFALGAVIVLIVLGVWLLKLIFKVSTQGPRGRNRRLAIVDSLVVDQKRQLLVIRRDNVEHLILTGGPQDVVIETGIPVEEPPAAQATRRPVPFMAGRRPNGNGNGNGSEAKAGETKPAIVPASAVAAGPSGTQRDAKAKDGSAPRSLRHTGLLRPVNQPETAADGYKPDISPETTLDSVKEMETEQANEGLGLDQTKQSEAKSL